MRVSVLVTLPNETALRASAQRAFTPESLALVLEAPPREAGLVIDEAFPPVPISGTTMDALDLAASSVASAPIFITRGTIDADRLGEVGPQSDGTGIFADPQIGTFPACPGSPAIGAARDVAQRLDVAALRAKGLDGDRVALAIMDTGISVAHLRSLGLQPKLVRRPSWSPAGVVTRPGSHPPGHGTMCAYDALIAAPRATLMDFPVLRSTQAGGSRMHGFLSDALLAYSYLLARFTAPSWKYKALVVNNSWGMYHQSWDFPAGHPGRYANNPNHPFNLIVGTLARAGADILFAAGNCGSNCPDVRCQNVVTSTIMGANAHPDVMTVAGCDINHVRAGYSSQGPGIAGMAHDKPDVTAYTHFLGSRVSHATAPDSGTSASCPVAAGSVAALRTRLTSQAASPSQLISAFRATALGIPARGWNADYGHGIIRPLAVAAQYGL